KCEEVIKDPATGDVVELRCTYDPETRSGMPQASRKVKATLHWVSASHAVSAEVRLYDHLFQTPDPDDFPEGKSYLDNLNPQSLEVLTDCQLEPSLATASLGDHFQFERLGYFCIDKDSATGKLVFNRTVQLRDTWEKIAKKSG
ncbi:MAG: glutamine--tRNA ligase, partial [Planctomycetales bacterium]|nr:glutamine--tRNA ligase [Planctomycetales bacterium]